jgi:hypothetical protein
VQYAYLCRAALVTCAVVLAGPSRAGEPRQTAPAVDRFDPFDNTQRSFVDGVRGQLMRKDFVGLDRFAEELLRTRARFSGGVWKLASFYETLGRPGDGNGAAAGRSPEPLAGAKPAAAPGEGDGRGDESWERHLALLVEWRTANPASAAAALALGDAQIGYAWKARGTGVAATVTDDSDRLFKERLRQASATLNIAKRLSSTNPHLYLVMLTLARGQGWTPASAEALFEEAVALEPLYLPIYSERARYLMPRWYGHDGDWERFAEATAARVGGRDGSVIYGQIAWSMSQMYVGSEFFIQNNVGWPRLKQAFIDREALYGPSVPTLNAFCLLAGSIGDKKTARDLFARLGDAWDPEVWRQRRTFDSYRTWANGI